MFYRRLRVLLILITTAMAVIAAKLFYLQVVRGDHYRRRAERNIAYKRDLETRRGHITDRNGVALAVDEIEYDVCVYLRRLERLKDPRAWCEGLAALMGRPTSEVVAAVQAAEERLRMLAAKAPEWRQEQDWKFLRRQAQPLFTHVGPDDIKRIEVGRDRLPQYVEGTRGYSVFIIRDTARRKYPHGDLACHIIGHMGSINREEYKDLKYGESFDGQELKRFFPDDRIGRAGIEARYERVLRGARGMLFGIKDVRGDVRPEMPSTRIEPVPGRDIRLTIDARVQRIAEETLDEQIALLSLQYPPHPGDPPVCGAVVLINPNTGDVLAAACSPRFDLNEMHDRYGRLLADPRMVFFHRATVGTYPLGSVFKIVVAVAGLEEDITSGHTEFTCHGTLTSGSHVLRCTGVHGTVELSRAIEQSCNVYFWSTGLLVGPEKLQTWARRLGLGADTGADVGEALGQIPLAVSRGELLNLAIGQGRILCTPLQVARMMGCVALEGKLPETRFCTRKRIRVHRLDMHPDRIGVIHWGMHDVVQGRRGTARRTAPVKGLTYAGKTGTAQTLTLRKDVYHAWFAGFAPFRTPSVAFSCVIENTRRAGGSEGAAPVIQRIFTRMMADPELRKFFPGGES